MKSRTKISKLHCDVLIIGSGSAGLRAAIEAKDCGAAHVIIVSKSKSKDPHTVLARGGINGALGTMDPEDSWMVHAADTLREGEFLADYTKVETLCQNAPDAINELAEWGVRFHKEPDGRLTQRYFGAHTYRRTCFYGDEIGKEIIRVLMKQVQNRNIKVVEGICIIKLLRSYKKIFGAIGVDIKNEKLVIFYSKAVILAGGGYSNVYAVSSSRISENYGESIYLAFEVGAELVDMEMIQFHPTGMVWPEKALGILATEAIRGEGGILLNSKGERFMKSYYPKRMELGPRDIVARAIYQEIVNGRGTKHDGVWLDITHVPKEKILDRLPTMYEQFKEINGIDISKEKMEVGPTAHYSMGGVVVDTKCRTKVRGLFAVGETISQIHGANRLGGNSLLDTVVFGKIVGSEAAKFMKIRDKWKRDNIPLLLRLSSNNQRLEDGIFVVKGSAKLLDELRELMKLNVGIIREEVKLKNALSRILELKKRFYSKDNILKGFKIDDDNGENIVLTWQVRSSLVVCEAIIRSALMRKESRGAHYRSDFQEKDEENWKGNIYCKKKGKQMILFKRNIKEVKGLLADLINTHIKPEHQREFE
jgi:succinate dehydrogenase / fumarate reductase, flavoprotein subunit